MGALLAPGLENERSRKSRGVPAKNHARENVLAIRDAQRANRERKAEASVAAAKPYKMKQFENVASRLMEPRKARPSSRGADESPPGSARGGEGGFLRRGAREHKPTPAEIHKARLAKGGKTPFLHECDVDPRPRTPRKERVPRAAEKNDLAPRRDVCHIHKNKANATRLEPPPRKAGGAGDEPGYSPRVHEQFGAVPAYLDVRKRELAAEAEATRSARPDPDCPPGMTKMDDGERVDALQALRRRKRELDDDLFKLPLNVTTVRMKARQATLHSQLDDVAKSISIFDREIVYIQA